MRCPKCQTVSELSWSRYMRSLSGRHRCLECDAVFRFSLTAEYWKLWSKTILAAIYSGLIINIFFVQPGSPFQSEFAALAISIVFPTLFWGTVFLVLNRRALDRLDTRIV